MKKLLMALALIAVFVEISLSDAKAEGFEYNALYYVIDLSGGTSAKAYPVVAFDAEPEGGWTDEYKTTKLVLRRVEAGAFTMGNPVDGFKSSSVDETQHAVTLTKPYYIGVFEVTQRQWELVMGTRPSCYQGEARPVEQVSWNMIRGDSDQYNWPSEKAVDGNSFVGKLRLKTGLMADLPTEAEWEYACRAGTTTHLNSGRDLTDRSVDENMNELGRYQGNVEIPEASQVGDGRGGYRENHTTVGSYKANAWGLYDMHGNVVEWCLDWRDDYPTSPVMDPVGPTFGSVRVLRGGGYTYNARGCRSAARNGHYDPSFKFETIGFRLACSVEHMMKSTYSAVPGEKVEIDTGLIGYTAKGLPSGLKYNKTTGMITGAAKKPTAVEGVTVKFTKSGAADEEVTIVVGPMPTIGVVLEGDTDGCKVTGAGAYLVGKKVTLKVTTKKGTAFVGFFKDGEPWPNEADSKKTSLAYMMGKEDVSLVAKFEKEKMSVGCVGLSCRSFTAGVAGSSEGIPLEIETQSGIKSVKVEKLPAGMKYDAKKKVITGAPTKAGDNTVMITVTAVSGAVEKKEIVVPVAAMPETAIGTFNGFVANGEQRIGTFALTTTDAGKLAAKVITAGGTVSFSGTCWDSLEDGVCKVTLRTKKGEFMTLALDSNAAWDANQLTGTYSPPNMTGWFDLSAQRNAFGKTWYFTAVGDEQTGWTFAYTKDAKAAALTVTLKADGSTAIAGKLGSIKISASGSANVGGMRAGAIIADFAPIITVNKVKRALSIHANLWFDRSNDHAEGAGGANFAE